MKASRVAALLTTEGREEMRRPLTHIQLQLAINSKTGLGACLLRSSKRCESRRSKWGKGKERKIHFSQLYFSQLKRDILLILSCKFDWQSLDPIRRSSFCKIFVFNLNWHCWHQMHRQFRDTFGSSYCILRQPSLQIFVFDSF
jgi:hypothetical protein